MSQEVIEQQQGVEAPIESEGRSQQIDDFDFGGPETPEASSSENQDTEGAAAQEVIDTPGGEETSSEQEGSDANSEAPDEEGQEQGQDQPVDLEAQLQEISGGLISTQDDFRNLLEEVEQLRAFKNNPEPKFETEAQKKVYDFVQKHGNGEDIAAAKTYLEVTALNLEEAEPIEVMFQKFRLDNPNLDEERATEIFNEEMEERFPEDMEDASARTKYMFEKEYNEALDQVSKIQKEYMDSTPKADQQQAQQAQDEALAEVHKAIDEQLKSYKGINLGFKDTEKGLELSKVDPENPVGNFKMEVSPEEAAKFNEIAKDPSKLWETLLKSENGEPNYGNYLDLLNYAMNKEKMIKEIASHGYNMAKIAFEKGQKNIHQEQPRGGRPPEGEDDLVAAIRKGQMGT